MIKEYLATERMNAGLRQAWRLVLDKSWRKSDAACSIRRCLIHKDTID
jgi:hypothetical protein